MPPASQEGSARISTTALRKSWLFAGSSFSASFVKKSINDISMLSAIAHERNPIRQKKLSSTGAKTARRASILDRKITQDDMCAPGHHQHPSLQALRNILGSKDCQLCSLRGRMQFPDLPRSRYPIARSKASWAPWAADCMQSEKAKCLACILDFCSASCWHWPALRCLLASATLSRQPLCFGHEAPILD